MKLVIGTKKYSTWSMRPWVFMRHHGVPFEEETIPFLVDPGTRRHTPETTRRLVDASPNARVPVLHLDDGTRINESLAICEYVSEAWLDGGGWPEHMATRNVARAVSLEMATGFIELRRLLPMSIGDRAATGFEPPEKAKRDIDRLIAIIGTARMEHRAQGPYLFGAFSIADAILLPAIFRFDTYGVHSPAIVKDYAESIRALPAVEEWCADVLDDPLEISAISNIIQAYPKEIAAACKI